MKEFTGKVAVITGAGSGIGRALAVALASEGARLALADMDEVGLSETAEQVREIGVACITHVLDVTDRSEMETFAETVSERFGQVNLLFNNAGRSLISDFGYDDEDDFRWLMDVNFWGVVDGTRVFLPYLRRANEAHIINISSLFGILGVPSQTAYCAAKFALRGFSEALHMELVDTPIFVSCVHPGGIKTNIVRNSRLKSDRFGKTMQENERLFDQFALTTPAQAAAQILKGVRKNRRRILIGRDAKIADMVVRIFPASYEKILGRGRPMMFGPE